jgi:hypothetical protein
MKDPFQENLLFALMEDLPSRLPVGMILASGVRHRLPDEEDQEKESRISGAWFFPVAPQSSDLFPQQTRTLLVAPG